MVSLWRSNDVEEWKRHWDAYEGEVKRIPKDDLAEDDAWLRNELPDSIKSRDPPFLTQPELCRVMKWKLARGKFRPRLQQFVGSISPATVEKASCEAFSALCNSSDEALKKASAALCELKGVGPATASIILASFDESVPFMADEAMSSVPGLGLQYTPSHQIKFARALRKRSKELNKIAAESSASNGAPDSKEDSGDSDGSSSQSNSKRRKSAQSAKKNGGNHSSNFHFTPHRISQCLWSAVVSQKEYKAKKKKATASKKKAAAKSTSTKRRKSAK